MIRGNKVAGEKVLFWLDTDYMTYWSYRNKHMESESLREFLRFLEKLNSGKAVV